MKKAEKKIPLLQAIKMHRRAYRILNKQQSHLFLSALLHSVFKAVTPYANIYLSAQIINELAGRRDPSVLWQLVIITLSVNAGLALLRAVLARWSNYIYAAWWHKVQKILTDKMLDMDFCSMDEQHTHDLRSQIEQNMKWSSWGLPRVRDFLVSLTASVTRIIGSLVLTVSLFTLPVPAAAQDFVFLNHPLFAVGIALVLFAVTFLAPVCSNKAAYFRVKYAEKAKFGNRLFGHFGFIGFENERALDFRIYEQLNICQYYQKENEVFSTKSSLAKKARGPMGAWKALSGVISGVFTGVVYAFACLKAWAGAFGVGSVTQYIGAITELSQGVSLFIETLGEMRSNAAFLQTTFEFLDIPNSMYQGSLTTEKRLDRNYEVEFRDVSFKYPNSESYALRHVSMKFKVGQRLAIVGMNGSGKTTFIKLLCRLYDPTEGEILLNGIDIRKYRYDDYMNIFAVVFQDFQLLAFPLGQNAAASETYDRERVNDALNKAGFADRLSELQDGIDTYLYKEFDEKGVEVSGGEAQKIAIARALYKDAPFIILDEPTAALDPIAEAEVYSKFDEIAGDKTAVYISHRLSSCRFCDEIVVFNDGQVVQKGTHEELLADEKGKYHELWYAQAQYYNE